MRVRSSPRASTLDKDHGRIESRQIWCAPTDRQTIGLAGVAQVVRLRCPVRDTAAARYLSLFRSLAIFLFQAQARGPDGKKSLPDFERRVHRKPGGLIRRFTQPRHEE